MGRAGPLHWIVSQDEEVDRAVLRALDQRLLDATDRRNWKKGRHVVGCPEGEKELWGVPVRCQKCTRCCMKKKEKKDKRVGGQVLLYT
jgi:hypothetical protein